MIIALIMRETREIMTTVTDGEWVTLRGYATFEYTGNWFQRNILWNRKVTEVFFDNGTGHFVHAPNKREWDVTMTGMTYHFDRKDHTKPELSQIIGHVHTNVFGDVLQPRVYLDPHLPESSLFRQYGMFAIGSDGQRCLEFARNGQKPHFVIAYRKDLLTEADVLSLVEQMITEWVVSDYSFQPG